MEQRIVHEFKAEVRRLREWCDAYPADKRLGEWELEYDGWPQLYSAFEALTENVWCRQWDKTMLADIVFSVARDNEIGHLLQVVRKDLTNFLCLASRAVDTHEVYAKSQLAAELGRIGAVSPQIEEVLWLYAHDADEYVSRLAMSALADVGSKRVINLVQHAWETGHEQQRMAVLYVLWRVSSPLLGYYLRLAELDGRPYLLNYVAQVRAGHPM